MALAGFPEWNDEYLTEWIGRILPEGWLMAVQEDTGEIVATAMACYDHTDSHPFGGALGWGRGQSGPFWERLRGGSVGGGHGPADWGGLP